MNIVNEQNIDFKEIETDISLIGSKPTRLYVPKASIIYLPGFGCDFYNHESFKERLVAYDYYAINFPAHGLSTWKSPNELTINHFANIVVKFMQNHNLHTVILIGHSSSAAVAALVNNLAPNKIIANILISPMDTTFQADAGEVNDIIIPRHLKEFEQLQRLKVANYDLKKELNTNWKSYTANKLAYFNKNADGLNIILSYLLSPELKQSIETLYATIKIPTLVLFGDSDGLIRTNEVASKMRELIPSASFAMIPSAGHEPALDNPNNYFTNVVAFIDAVVGAHDFNHDANN